jgi:hypothetical protein
MKYRLFAAMVGALCVASCIDSTDGNDYGPPPDYSSGERAHCERFTSCATCTPVLGCGWCQSGDKGLCTSEPNRCGDAVTFSWTWELAYCPAEPDGGGGDGGGGWNAVPPNGTPTADAGATDAPATVDASATVSDGGGTTASDAVGLDAPVDAPHE